MSIEQYGDEYIPTCDLCGAELPPEYRHGAAINAIHNAGWRMKKDADGKWQDFCLECQEAFTANEEGRP